MEQLTTKEKILVAAKQLFAAHGYAGTSAGKIAKLAGVNHSLIFHHFKDKKSLWLAVKQYAVKNVEAQSKTLPDIGQPFKNFLYELITNNLRFYQEQTEVARMINWQRLENNNQEIGVTLSEETANWIQAFRHYQSIGEVNPKLKIEFIITLILSIVSSAALDPIVFIQAENDKSAYVDFCVERLLIALSQ
jgi:AcrR family transcriptional regulator